MLQKNSKMTHTHKTDCFATQNFECEFCDTCKLCQLSKLYKDRAEENRIADKKDSEISGPPIIVNYPVKKRNNIMTHVCVMIENKNNRHNVLRKKNQKEILLTKTDRTNENPLKNSHQKIITMRQVPKETSQKKGHLSPSNKWIKSKPNSNNIQRMLRARNEPVVLITESKETRVGVLSNRKEQREFFKREEIRESQDEIEIINKILPTTVRLKKEFSLVRSHLNEKIEGSKRMCQIKNQHDSSNNKRQLIFESTIQENQKKFFIEKHKNSLTYVETSSIEKTEKFQHHEMRRAERFITERQMPKIGAENPNKAEKRGCKNISQMKALPRKRDVGTYVAPVKYVEQILRNIPHAINNVEKSRVHLSQMEKCIINTKYHKKIAKHVQQYLENNGLNTSKTFEKKSFAKRIEEYKKEYCEMSNNIRDNVKVINKFTRMPQNNRMHLIIDNENEHVTVGDSRVHGQSATEPATCSVNIENISKSIKDKRESRDNVWHHGVRPSLENIVNIKMEIKQKKDDIANFFRTYETNFQPKQAIEKTSKYDEQKSYKTTDRKRLFFEKTKFITKKSKKNPKIVVKCSNASKTRKKFCSDLLPVKVQTAYEIMSLDYNKASRHTGGGDVTKLNESIGNVKNENCKRICNNQQVDKTCTIVNESEQAFGPVQTQISAKQNFSQQNIRPKVTTSKQCDCIKLKFIRKQRHFTLKEHESDGEIICRRQEKINRKTQNNDCNITLGVKENSVVETQRNSTAKNQFHKCTEYFVRNLSKSSRFDLTHCSQIGGEKIIRSTSLGHKNQQRMTSVQTYRSNLATRKQETKNILNDIDEKIQHLNHKLKRKFLQDETEMIRPFEKFKDRFLTRVTAPTTQAISKITKDSHASRNTVDLNLDQVFANKNNWIILDFQDEMIIRRDFCQMLTEGHKQITDKLNK